MRVVLLGVVTLLFSLESFAQHAPPALRRPTGNRADGAERSVQQAMEQLARERKIVEKEVEILKHLRLADEALTDPMQPSVAVQKAYDELVEAWRLDSTDMHVRNGVVEARDTIDGARKSPTSADFGRLRMVLQREAIGPASRYAVRITAALQEETLAWIKVERLIGEHLNALVEIQGNALQAAQR